MKRSLVIDAPMTCQEVIVNNISNYASIASIRCIESCVTSQYQRMRISVRVDCPVQADPSFNALVKSTTQPALDVVSEQIPHQQLGVCAG